MSGYAIRLGERDGWVTPLRQKNKKRLRRKRYRTPDEAEEDRKFRTGIVVKKGRL